MADEKHLYLSWGGDYVPNTLPGEIWQVGLRLSVVFGSTDPVGTLPDNWDVVANTVSLTGTGYTVAGNWTIDGPGSVDLDPGDYLVNNAKPAIEHWMLYANLNNQVRLRWISLAPIGAPSGNMVPAPGYAAGSPCLLEYTSGYPVGNLSGTQLPPQNSVVVSHRTLQVGPRGRGRMFMPSSSSSILSGARVATTPATEIAAEQALLLESLATDSGVSTPDIRPIVTGSPWLNYAVINNVQVGNVMDSQRRRRNALTETVVSDSVSY